MGPGKMTSLLYFQIFQYMFPVQSPTTLLTVTRSHAHPLKYFIELRSYFYMSQTTRSVSKKRLMIKHKKLKNIPLWYIQEMKSDS